MVEKLSPAKERQIIRGIEKAIACTRSGMDPDQAMTKVAKEMKFSPEITKRACEAFNKSKTVFMLEKLGADQRANNFSLVDPNNVVSSIFLPDTTSNTLNIEIKDFSKEFLPKAASMQKSASAERIPEKSTRDDGVTDNMVKKALEHKRSTFTELENERSKVGQHKIACEENITKAIRHMETMSNKSLHKVAHLIVNRFGENGKLLMNVVSCRLNKDLPMEKTANAAILPAEGPYPYLVKAIEEAQLYKQAKEVYEYKKKVQDLLFKSAATPPAPPSPVEVGTSLLGAVGGGGIGLLSGVYSGVSSDLIPRLKSLVTQRKPKGSAVEEAILDSSFQDQLYEIKSSDAMTDLASDPFLKSFPYDDVRTAYENVVNITPELADGRYRPILTTLVKKQLSQNNMYDPAELNQITEFSKNLNQTIKDRDRVSSDNITSLLQASTASPNKDVVAMGESLQDSDADSFGDLLKNTRDLVENFGKKNKK